jgi:hypothetical protein
MKNAGMETCRRFFLCEWRMGWRIKRHFPFSILHEKGARNCLLKTENCLLSS